MVSRGPVSRRRGALGIVHVAFTRDIDPRRTRRVVEEILTRTCVLHVRRKGDPRCRGCGWELPDAASHRRHLSRLALDLDLLP